MLKDKVLIDDEFLIAGAVSEMSSFHVIYTKHILSNFQKFVEQ
jgi:hypothetical protein